MRDEFVVFEDASLAGPLLAEGLDGAAAEQTARIGEDDGNDGFQCGSPLRSGVRLSAGEMYHVRREVSVRRWNAGEERRAKSIESV